MLTHYDAIVQAGKLLAVAANWTQDAYARDKTGTPIQPNSRRAVKWSAYGVMYSVYRCKMDDEKLGDRAADYAAQCESAIDMGAQILFKCGIVPLNDRLGHAAVLDAMRVAARRMKDVKPRESHRG